MCDTGNPKPVLCGNLLGWGGEGRGRGGSGRRGRVANSVANSC